ncbi:MAG: hypothetical protein LBP76_05615 [Treponema sp.]|nr:hypothetical protein [Treponema sp.]
MRLWHNPHADAWRCFAAWRFILRSGKTAAGKGRFIGIDAGKRKRDAAFVTRSGKVKTDAYGDVEQVEKTDFAKGGATAEGLAKLYKKLPPADKTT